jgi:DNA repair exonuclease SbcCD ATPase subunit
VGEDRTGRQSGHRVTVDEAARHLGLTVDAVRKRVQREQIAYEKDEAGRVRIILDEFETLQDIGPDSTGQATGTHEELMEELRRTNELLREVITTRDEEIRRRDTIIMNMTEAMKALNPPAPEDPSEARESPESSGPAGGIGESWEELDTERARREMAESTLREGMAEEQRRREEAERERDDLRRELHALRDLRESPQTVGEEPERAESRPSTEGRQESPEAFGSRGSGTARGSLWRRIFGR